jgi:4-amino-4-deoxy-L-arabinose transferase-like glycosyltransferase
VLDHKRFPVFIALLATLAFVPFLGKADLFDWDELNFAEVSREMIVLGDYLRLHIDFQPFWEKPPLFFWMQALAMQIFGIGENTARLPNAICGIVTLLIIYRIGRHMFDRTFGALWVLAYFGSMLPHLYFKTGLIDPWFNLFIFLGIYFFILFYWKKSDFTGPPLKYSSTTYILLSGLSLGLGILTKGPVAFLIFALCLGVHFVWRKFKLPASVPRLALLTIVAAGVTLVWYGIDTMLNGPGFITGFTQYQIELLTTKSAGHEGFPGFHFVVNLFGCFPASIIALPALFKIRAPAGRQKNFQLWMLILFWVVIILFTIVQSKIIHYSSMVYFPLTFLAAVTIYEVMHGRAKWRNWVTVTIAIIGGFIGIALCVLPIAGRNISSFADRFKDPTAADSIMADVSWVWYEGFIGLVLIVGIFSSINFIRKRDLLPQGWDMGMGAIVLFLSTALAINIASVHLTPKILSYSQGANIEFFRSLEGVDCYVDVLGYKSYAHLFYTKKRPGARPESRNTEWLLYGDIDKPAYFSVKKKNMTDHILGSPGIETLYEKNGFVYMKRSVE